MPACPAYLSVPGDVKPENVMLCGGGAVKIGDFGQSQFFDRRDTFSRTLGTPAYLGGWRGPRAPTRVLHTLGQHTCMPAAVPRWRSGFNACMACACASGLCCRPKMWVTHGSLAASPPGGPPLATCPHRSCPVVAQRRRLRRAARTRGARPTCGPWASRSTSSSSGSCPSRWAGPGWAAGRHGGRDHGTCSHLGLPTAENLLRIVT